MSNRVNPRICGGIFFALLLAAKPQRTNQNEHLKGDTDSLSDTSIIMNLCKVVKPDYKEPSKSKKDSFETTVSKYKSGIIGYSNYIPITASNESRLFNKKITENYPSALKAMCEFVEYYIDNGVESDAAERLVLNLLELIYLDDVFDDKMLYVCADERPRSKKEVLNLEVIEIQPFLLGVLHFITQHCKNNKVGADTFEEYWIDCEAEKEFVGGFGSEYKFKGKIRMYDVDNLKTEADEPEHIEPQVVEEIKEPEREINTSFTKNGITFQVNMVQSGNNNTQVAYAENVYSSWNNCKNDTEGLDEGNK